jgi:hypothetical protein
VHTSGDSVNLVLQVPVHEGNESGEKGAAEPSTRRLGGRRGRGEDGRESHVGNVEYDVAG